MSLFQYRLLGLNFIPSEEIKIITKKLSVLQERDTKVTDLENKLE